ncbi:integrator complex subunit 11 [Dendrobium catenatum]|uniref:Integrator complex subunit 11 n=1 Tax=Dendrobium catenatum TaxID=906689 RepID=A0A2I0VWX6_9ASPA|nr:integrator complex subunit 11 [Dendrobium catenatum]
MNADSVAGPDGYTVKFFQHLWQFIYEDVYATVLDFFNGTPIPKFFTSTSIALIPKSNMVNSWNDFRPISLCTIFYKLISKILVNRLSVLLPKLISPNQMGFVKGRAIVDNILLAQEFCQDLDIKTRGGNMILKLDIAKAYDNIN